MITFNYVCITDDCSVTGTIPIKKDRADESRVEYCYGCDQPLKQIGEMINMVIQGDAQTRMLRNQDHFKRRAKKHAASDEQQALKRERQNQEFSKMGLTPKNK